MTHQLPRAALAGGRPPGPPADGLPAPERYGSLSTIWLAMGMAVLDGVVMNLVLPVITRGLHVDATSAVWVINAYQIAIIMLLLPLAAAGEIVGYRKVYLCGVALFAAASLGCALARDLTALVAWRFAQGAGAAALMAMNGALLRLTYPSRDLARGMGYNAVLVSVTSAAGPSIAAGALALGSWRYLFLLNLPLAAVVLATGVRTLPASPPASRSFDGWAAALNAVTFGALFLAAVQIVDGRASLATPALVALALAAGAGLVRRGWGEAAPMIPLDLLAIPSVRLSYLASIFAFTAQMTVLIALPFYLQPRFTHIAMGLLITGYPLGVLCGAPMSPRLSERFGASGLGLCGLLLTASGFGALPFASAAGSAPIVACLAVAGFGMGLFQSPNNHTMMRDAPRARSGAAAGMMAVCRLLGQTTGALAAALSFRAFGTGSAEPFFIAAAFAALAALMARRPSPAGSSAPIQEPEPSVTPPDC